MPRKKRTEERGQAAARAVAPEASHVAFPIVAVGASAGGLEAFRHFLTGVSTDTGMAFVLILHLAPKQESALAEILSRATKMPVAPIDSKSLLEPNHVYVLPPGKEVLLADGHLELRDRPASRMPPHPIDEFMRSLAVRAGERAIGVVLSGTGNDGALGALDIRAAGGIVFAQDETAEHTAMPQSVVAMGGADAVLHPEAIGRAISEIAVHAFARASYPAEAAKRVAGSRDEAERRRLLELLRRENGLDFTHYRRNTVERRILRRMALHRIQHMADYVEFATQNPGELQSLHQDILIGVTAFFRDPESYEMLKRDVIPRILERKARNEPVRVWVLGCSTGQEAYSVAIAFHEQMDAAKAQLPLQVFATDVNAASIEIARVGIYPRGIVQDLSPERLRRYFVETNGSYRVSKVIRDACVFARHDALSDPPFSRVDLVVCRNVLIYLENTLQQQLMPILHYAIAPEGFLWLGKSESAAAFGDLFQCDDTKHRICTRKSTPVRTVFALPRHDSPQPASFRPVLPSTVQERDPQKDAERILVARYAPPAVVLDSDLNVIQFRGDTSPFLVPPQGRASLQLYKMLREGLLVGVRGAIARARREKMSVREEGLRVRRSGQDSSVSIVVMPLSLDDASRGLIVAFEEPGEGSAAQARQRKGDSAAKRASTSRTEAPRQEAQRLRQELDATREYLQSVIEELEAANEELQTANEEGQSANEEMQSVNEELETSREEIQSANEELTTTNDELHQRNVELAQSNNDFANLLASVQLAIVMLDWDLRIRRFTPAAEKLFNLRASDVGRPLTDIKLNVEAPDIEEILGRVLQHGSPFEREVKDRDGRWHWLRVRPYRTPQDNVQGALVIVIDIDALKRADERVRESESRFSAIADSAPVLMWVHGLAGCEFVNAAYEQFVGKKSEALVKDGWVDMIHPDDRAEFMAAYRRAFSQHIRFEALARFLRVDGAYRWMKSIGAPRYMREGEFAGFVGSSIDITDLKEAEQGLREADRAKDEFLGTLGHELRNPLAAISNASYLLSTGGNRDRTPAIKIIERQTHNMLRIVDDLLDVSRITHGKIKLRVEAVNVEKAARAAGEATRHERVRAEQQLEMSFPAKAAWVSADPARLEQVLTNVLGNASKFTPRGGHLWLSVEREAPAGGRGPVCAVIRVRDDGPGIDPAVLPRVFELFVQGGRTDDRARTGVGIGLPLARHLVEMHGGTIALRNLPEKGSEVVVRLPAVAAPADEPAKAAPHPKAIESRRVLLIEDHEDGAEALSGVLARAGHEVRVVRVGGDALDAARDFKPDLALVDVGLPDIDGYSVARRFREDPDLRDIRLVALSGYARKDDVDRALDAGFDMHLAKPTDADALLEAVAGDTPAEAPR